MRKVAIIGSNGFIGRHLTERLMKEKDLALSLFGKSETSAFKKALPYQRIDFFNKTELEKNFAGIEIVYYLASETIPATSWENPSLEIEKNLIPFINFLQVAATTGVRKVVFVSSAGTIYGTTTNLVTEDANKNPFSPYGITKLTMENYLRYYKVKYGIQCDIFRVSNVYGEGQNTTKGLGIVNTFLEKIIRDKEVKIFGDGNTVRNYIYVKDVAELLSRSLNDLTSSETYNVSSNNTVSINDLVKIIKTVVSEDFRVVYSDLRQSDNSAVFLDNSRILKAHPDFKFSPIEDGIAKTYSYIKELK
ncbi:MAG: NAD-dependent epimerase/dehydratase family protein [Bacteroidota bacterium]